MERLIDVRKFREQMMQNENTPEALLASSILTEAFKIAEAEGFKLPGDDRAEEVIAILYKWISSARRI